MQNKNIFKKIIGFIEQYLPMTFGSFLLFLFIIYLFIIVGRSVLNNYDSNKQILEQKNEVEQLAEKVKTMEYEINYYQTDSYKEKQAREKLGYISPGEKVVSLPMDQKEDKNVEQEPGEVIIKTPNYIKWWRYYFE